VAHRPRSGAGEGIDVPKFREVWLQRYGKMLQVFSDDLKLEFGVLPAELVPACVRRVISSPYQQSAICA
jgi:hypothetical protein